MSLPTFLLFGAGKAGTTSVYNYLQQHPEVFMSAVKEPRFFVYDPAMHDGPGDYEQWLTVRTREQYEALFKDAGDAKAIGEGSIQYLAQPHAAKRIREMIPDVRLVAILRNPAERAFSSFMMYVRDTYETRSFDSAIKSELEGDFSDSPFAWLSYLKPGLYGQQLQNYLSVFDRNQIFIALYEDLRSDPIALMRKIYAHIGVDPDYTPTTSASLNASGRPKSKLIARLTRKSKLTSKVRETLPSSVMSRIDRVVARVQARNLEKVRPELATLSLLQDYYAEDVRLLSCFLDRDLSAWLGRPERPVRQPLPSAPRRPAARDRALIL